MKCAVFYGKRNIKVEERPIPKIGETEVLIRVKACGICGTEIGMYTGRIQYSNKIVGRIIGHEVTGIIEERGNNVENYLIGEKVVLLPTVSCGRCSYCKAGNENLCHDIIGIGHDIDGGYAEYIKVNTQFLAKLPQNVSLNEGVLLTDCLPTAMHAIDNFANIKAGTSVGIWGTGGQGLIALQIAKLNGANVILVGRRKKKLELAKELGAEYIIDIENEDVYKQIREYTNNCGVDIAIETGGYPLAITQSIATVRRGGVVILVGLQKEQVFDIEDLVWHEKSVIGSFWSTLNDFSRGIHLVNKKKIILEPLISHTYKLDQIEDAFNLLERRDQYVAKVIIEP